MSGNTTSDVVPLYQLIINISLVLRKKRAKCVSMREIHAAASKKSALLDYSLLLIGKNRVSFVAALAECYPSLPVGV